MKHNCVFYDGMVFNNKEIIRVSANSDHLQVITILLKEYHISYMPILRGDAEISSSLRVTVSLFSGMSNGQ